MTVKSDQGTRSRRARSWWEGVVGKIDAATSTPKFDYYILAAITAILTGVGLLMVLSSSMASSLADSNSVWTDFFKQAGMVVVGLVGLYFAIRMSPATIKKISPWAMGLAVILLILVLIPGLGTGLQQMGSQSWLVLGPVTIQPSEVAKLAIAVWGSAVLSERALYARSIREVLGFFTLVVVFVIFLVAFERDLGMVASVMIVFLALAWFVGVPKWVTTTIIAGGLGLAVLLTLTAGYRSNRVEVFRETLFGKFPNTQGTAYQSYQGFLSLGDGSFLGQGLGQSRAKWFYLPEAKNDFIFAVVGEEMGFLGASIVILLFALLGWVGMRIALNQADPFLRLMAATVTTGIVIQAFINIGYVTGLLPVTGIQLPLISSGGTSAIITLVSMGLLLNCARHEPETVSSMQTYGRPVVDKLLGFPEPRAFDPSTLRRGPWVDDDDPRSRSGNGSRKGAGARGRSGGRSGSSRRGLLSDRHHEVQRFGEPVTRRNGSPRSRRNEGNRQPSSGSASQRRDRAHDRAPRRRSRNGSRRTYQSDYGTTNGSFGPFDDGTRR